MSNKTRTILIVAMAILLVAGVVVAIVAFSSIGQGSNVPETPETSGATVAPTEEAHDPNAMAKVETDGNVGYVYSLEEMLEAIQESGKTVITLQQDISHNKSIEMPYSCTIDLAGFAISTNPQQGLGLQVRAAGTENRVTTLRNGKIASYADSLRVKAGAVVLENMQLHTAYGSCVALYDPTAGNASRIADTTLVSVAGAAVAFNEPDVDYSDSTLTLENSTLICPKAEGAQILTASGSTTVSPVINLSSGVKLYSYAGTACPNGFIFDGSIAVKERHVSVTADQDSWDDMTCWTTESDQEVLDILMIGNSFCFSYVDELYGMAESLGYQLNITNLYYGGASIKSHWNWLNDPVAGNGKCEYYITGALGRYKHPTITTLTEAQKVADWDVISCQQHFDGNRTATYDAGYESCMPYAADMFDYLKQNFPEADLYWHETWSYGVGYVHPNNKDDDPENDIAEGDVLSTAIQTRQYTTIRDVSRAICAETGVAMIPTGDAWQLARGRLGDTLNKIDFCHDGDVGGGQYLTACVWLEILTGESCIGNTWRPGDYILFEDKIPALQTSAHEAVAAISEK